MNCKKCGIDFIPKKGLKNYCSLSCRNSRSHTIETKKKIRNSVIAYCISNPKPKRKKTKEEEFREKSSIQPERISTLIRIFNLDVEKDEICEINRIKNELNDQYWNKNLSTTDLGYIYSTSSENIRNYLDWFKIKKRPNIGTSTRFKQGYHTSWSGNKFYYRSSLELKLANILDEHCISYEMEPFQIKYIFNGNERRYTPDFYLTELNTLIEVKSSYFYEQEKEILNAKFKSARNLGYIMLMYLDDKFIP